MLSAYILISDIDEDEDLLEQLGEQGVCTDDWDIIVALPADQDGLSEHFSRDDEGKLVCNHWHLDRLISAISYESVWYEEIEVNNETCFVGVQHH